LTKELLNGQLGLTTYPLGQRTVLYDAAGRRSKQRFKSEDRTGYLNLDTTQSYAYDATKYWLRTVSRDGAAQEWAQYDYDTSTGRLTAMTYGNGASVAYEYYPSGALRKISHRNGSGVLIASVVYYYDKAGNVTAAVLDDALTYNGDATVTYQYDNLHRLTKEQCTPAPGSSRFAYTWEYWYDAVGNRTRLRRTDPWCTNREMVFEYSPRNELIRYSDPEGSNNYWILEYNLRGNLTKKYHTVYDVYNAYEWDSQDHMTKTVGHSGQTTNTTEYNYDLLGRRVAKRFNGGPWRWYFYDGLKVIAEGTGQDDRIYYTNSPAVIGGIICRDKNGTEQYWYHYDRLGTPLAVTDANGGVAAVYQNTAFGYGEYAYGSSGFNQMITDPQPYHLTTKEFDPNVGLYYFNARWYDATIGRFLSRDPRRSMNPYGYPRNNPMRFIDPTGRETLPLSYPPPYRGTPEECRCQCEKWRKECYGKAEKEAKSHWPEEDGVISDHVDGIIDDWIPELLGALLEQQWGCFVCGPVIGVAVGWISEQFENFDFLDPVVTNADRDTYLRHMRQQCDRAAGGCVSGCENRMPPSFNWPNLRQHYLPCSDPSCCMRNRM